MGELPGTGVGSRCVRWLSRIQLKSRPRIGYMRHYVDFLLQTASGERPRGSLQNSRKPARLAGSLI